MDRNGHVLRFEGVTKDFDGERVLENVSLEIEHGECVALVGPSGAGKTTLLRLANGALQPDAGSVVFDGEPVTSEDVAVAYGGETLVDRRTALANVLSGRVGELTWWRGLVEPLSPRDPEPGLALLEAVGLADRTAERVDRLSAGERQRVAFARALVRDAPAVLADEPTANLDPASRENVLDVLHEVTGERMLLTVLHDVELALDRYERIVGLAGGGVQFDAVPDEVTDEMLDSLFASGKDASRGRAADDRRQRSSDVPAGPEREVPWDV